MGVIKDPELDSFCRIIYVNTGVLQRGRDVTTGEEKAMEADAGLCAAHFEEGGRKGKGGWETAALAAGGVQGAGSFQEGEGGREGGDGGGQGGPDHTLTLAQ